MSVIAPNLSKYFYNLPKKLVEKIWRYSRKEASESTKKNNRMDE